MLSKIGRLDSESKKELDGLISEIFELLDKGKKEKAEDKEQKLDQEIEKLQKEMERLQNENQ